MNLSLITVVARKELTDSFRDRRALYAIVFGSLFGPVLIAFMLHQIAGQEKAAQEIRIPVVGAERAPVLIDWLLQQSGVEITAGPADPELAIRNRQAEMVLVIKKEFAEKFRDSSPAPIQVFSDSTQQSVRTKVRRLEALLNRFNGEMGSLRLIARGVSPEVASALKIERVDVANAQQRAAIVLNILPMFLILAAFTAGMQISTDSTAGERERGSLEPLLLNPITRWQLVIGKWLAAAGTAFIGMIVTLLLTAFTLSRLPLEDLGVRIHLETPRLLLLLAAIAPMALVAPAVQMYLACFAKSFKEAQSYMGYLVFLITIPGVISAFFPLTNRPWLHPIPMIGQYALGAEVLEGNLPSPLTLTVAALSAIAVAGLLLWLAQRLFSNEKIIFGC